MRIAFICKRRYMGKDVILDRYARLYEIPFQLARLGHSVRGFCLSYQRHSEGEWTHDSSPGNLAWESQSLGRFLLPRLVTYPSLLLKRLRAFEPDLLIGASDIPNVALTAWLAKKLCLPYAIDLYDNFEGFGQARIPGMVPLLRHAVRNAGFVMTTSEPLRAFVANTYHALGPVVAMPSTVDKKIFQKLNKSACRSRLRLPPDAVLVGTAGGLLAERGIGTLYDAWRKISVERADVHLVLAGPVDPRLPPPSHDRVHYLGMLEHRATAELFNALDVGVIYLRDTVFGRYCFPQKAYEMLACGLPVIAANIGVMSDLLSDMPECLYSPDDSESLAKALSLQLAAPRLPPIRIEDWEQVTARIEMQLRKLVAATGSQA